MDQSAVAGNGVTAPYDYPREIEFIAELPKTRSGKIRRVELRQAELEKKGATAASGRIYSRSPTGARDG
jgi:acyl-coenzyme A synthetase/AMP-(fatty) acid ligase